MPLYLLVEYNKACYMLACLVEYNNKAYYMLACVCTLLQDILYACLMYNNKACYSLLVVVQQARHAICLLVVLYKACYMHACRVQQQACYSAVLVEYALLLYSTTRHIYACL